MSTAIEHYAGLLARHYSWIYGGFEASISANSRLLEDRAVRPSAQGATALDLGAGCGFMAIPLARSGFRVVAVDTDAALLEELEEHKEGLTIETRREDIRDFTAFSKERPELAVCMTDTIIHLDSKEDVVGLFANVHKVLPDGGRFLTSFRDLSFELKDVDRFIPVRSDESRIFTCFLEYEPETVKVHDIVYERKDGEWALEKGCYRKLRLSTEWVKTRLEETGFSVELSEKNGFVLMDAVKAGSL